MGVVIRMWVWLECIGVVSGCCYKEVYRFLHITYRYIILNSTCIALAHFCSSIPNSLFILKMFFRSLLIIPMLSNERIISISVVMESNIMYIQSEGNKNYAIKNVDPHLQLIIIVGTTCIYNHNIIYNYF